MGILGIRKVPAEGLRSEVQRIQYHGKGGTSPYNFLTDKIKQNIGKQSKLMKQGGDGNPDVMGMMYWTTTGLTESIYKRKQNVELSPPAHVVQTSNRRWREDEFLLPTSLTFQNYQRLFGTTPVIRWLFNTMLIAGKCRTIMT